MRGLEWTAVPVYHPVMARKPEPLEEKIAFNIETSGLILPGDTILIGFSGGADSTALLHALFQLSASRGFRVAAAHLNHSLRGAESDGDEEFCRDFAGKLGIAFYASRLPAGELRKDKALSLEEAARSARRAFLERTRGETGAARIALAHHRDDQVETVLMRLFRGASPRGLAGMQFASDSIIRPMLNVPKSEILAYCAARRLDFRHDSSNDDEKPPRNKLRRRVIPFLENELNPRLRERIFHAAELLRRDSDYLDALAEESFKASRRRAADAPALDRRKVAKAPQALLDRIWLMAVFEASGRAGAKLDSRHLAAMNERLKSGANGDVCLPDGLAAVFSRESIRFITPAARRTKSDDPAELRFDLKRQGTTRVEFGGYEFRFRVLESPPANPKMKPKHTEYLDLGRISGQIRLRYYKRGDTFRPLGMKGGMKLSDYFTNSKIDREIRGGIPLLCDDEKILWIVGKRIDDRCGLTRSTTLTVAASATALKQP